MNVAATVFEIKHRVSSFFNAVVKIGEDRSDKTWLWGEKGDLPHQILHQIADSPTATACAEAWEAFLSADGFSDEKAGETLMGNASPLTANQLLTEIASYMARLQGFALVVRNDLINLEISSVQCIELERLEKYQDGRFRVYRNRKGHGLWKKNEYVDYSPWEPTLQDTDRLKLKESIKAQMEEHGKQIGRILFAFTPKPGDGKYYPIPTFWSASYDMASDAELGRLDWGVVKKGLLASAIVTTPKLSREKTLQNGDVEGLPTGPSVMEGFLANLRRLTGEAEDRAFLIHLENDIQGTETAPPVDIKFLNAFANATDINVKRTGISERVTMAWQVPPVLIGLYKSGSIGDTKKIADEIALFNSKVNRAQRFISSVFKQLFPQVKDWTITTLNPITYIPSEVYAKMTDEEIRGIIGLGPLKKNTTKESDALSTAISMLSPLVANKVLDSLSEGEIRNLVGLETLDDDSIKETLNADQIRSLRETAAEVKAGTIETSAAIEIVKLGFGVNRSRAAKILGIDLAKLDTPVTPPTEQVP